MSDNNLEKLRQRLEVVAAENNVILEKVEKSDVNGGQVSIIVDNLEDVQGSPNIDFLAGVSPDFSKVVEEFDLFPEQYSVQLSSLGVTRPLTEDRHWKKAVNHLVNLTFYKDQDEQNKTDDNNISSNKILAMLDSFDPEKQQIVIRRQKPVKKGVPPQYESEETIDLSKIRRAKVEVEF